MGQLPRPLIIGLIIAGAAGFVVAFETRQFPVFAILSVLAILFAASTYAHAPAAKAVRGIGAVPLRIDVWGTPIAGDTFRIDRIQSFGAGMLIWCTANNERTFIKVAQPTGVQSGEDGVTIARARYVQVNKKTMAAAMDAPALVLQIVR